MGILFVALGGGLGATLRYTISYLLEMKQKPFYMATFLVNIFGSFAMGVCIQFISGNPHWALFLATGILGGLTTFSTFAYDILRLYQEKNPKILMLYSVGTLLLSMFAISLGYYIAS